MEVHELSFYSQFKCTMGACPNTCCRGWQIVFDDGTARKYKEAPGLSGIRLRSAITKRNGMTMFRRRRGFCPFFTKERTCGVQQTLGEDYMPEVCRIFPRQRVNYGDFAEETLFLACPEAARLFLRNRNALCLRTVKRPVSYARLGTNEDSGFLRELILLREMLIERTKDTRASLAAISAELLTFAGRLQQHYIRQAGAQAGLSDAGEASALPLPKLRDCIGNAGPDFIIPAGTAHRMITGGFYHIFLKKTAPFLYRMCRMYFSEYGRLTESQAQTHSDRLRAALHAGFPEADAILRGHLAYYLLLEFLSAYENYSFVRIIAAGIMHTQLLELFLALYWQSTKSLSEEEIIQIIAALDRRGRHCAEVEAAMFEELSPFLRGWIEG